MKVLYIGGAGRSGSTLLERILGNVPGFFSIGEARYFWEHWARGNLACGCGVKLAECDFWQKVKERLDSEIGVNCERVAAFSRRLNRTRCLPRLMSSGFWGASAEWKELGEKTQMLYQIVAQTANNQVLVDTSKNPSHLFLLRNLPEIDLRVLHLVRDGRAVAYSWSRRRKLEPSVVDRQTHMMERSAFRAMLIWLVENAFTLTMRRGLSYTLMRYEDFVQTPKIELQQALSKLGFESVDLSLLAEEEILCQPTHSIGGNPIRFSTDKVRVRLDTEWLEKTSMMTQFFLSLMAFPALVYFGYDFIARSTLGDW